MKYLIVLVVIFAFFSLIKSDAASSKDPDAYDVEYSLDTVNYNRITTLNVRTLKQNQNLNPSHTSSPYWTQIYSDQINDARLIETLNEGSGEYFQLRLCRSGVCSPSTYLPVEHLKHNLGHLTLNMSLHQSNVKINAINLRADPFVAASKGRDGFFLTMYANVVAPKVADLPDTQSFLDRVRKETEVKQQSANDNNKSFFAKYWYYIVPVVVIMLLSSFTSPEQGGAPAE